ncbi:50S ribosomal protein L9 [Chitinivibrio alkaliphilus]|uniref:Large ribosomal subunit protein bL9 n=1 Tax=Chitinivibrio alkaliphilus ACht1 TaxID=1313304 RepID=U7DAS3_9BACT|nr:50S ribosomal protein L9 [Chitinivibrio alkaliphilus]ERP31500.1 50S ribosomal protein L9 [Chitinivibrio alkaliphilus ACht1]
MKIILIKDYPRLGSKNDVVEVKRGYARNYLIPEGIAVMATKGNLRHAEEMKKYSHKHEERAIALAQENAEKVAGLTVTLQRNAKAESERIYGSVSSVDIAEALQAEGIDVHHSSVLIPERIKNLGVYDITVKLHKSIEATLKLWVVREEE